MTHVANVEALTRLVSFCSGYGGSYNPGRQTLQLNALVSQLAQAQQALQNVVLTKFRLEGETNNRSNAFEEAELLATRIANAMEAAGADPKTMADVRGYVRLLTGTGKDRVPVAPDQTEGEAPTRRSRPRTYLSKAEYFASLVQVVVQEPLYQPNEVPLAKATLMATVASLNDLNNRVTHAREACMRARRERNHLLYVNAQSVYSTVKAVKNYLRSLFGPSSLEFRQVGKISFTKPAK